ncbi:hypothetical protein DFP72DRAFT_1038927 [Ephemerocybe angulata]|uniref:Uncharacterized protein n=1 Tax=Ephemerocybe angulata TaxID=980116 RepID=A0A8H6IKA9_9AGAR|nr:hypothetical protein DFP72DRAFT_1038927 [Tulosesus angulatus]
MLVEGKEEVGKLIGPCAREKCLGRYLCAFGTGEEARAEITNMAKGGARASRYIERKMSVQHGSGLSEILPFIVVFKEGVTSEQIGNYCKEVEDAVRGRYDQGAGILNGFSATIPASFHASLVGDELIDYIEPDGIATIQ